MKTAADARGRSLLVLLVMLWAVSWPATKIGVSAMPPVSFARYSFIGGGIWIVTKAIVT